MGRQLSQRVAKSRRKFGEQRRHRPDYYMLIYIVVLMAFGLVMLYAIGPERANLLNHIYGSNYSENHFVLKQLFSISLAVIFFAVTAIIPFNQIEKRANKLIAIGIGLCVMLMVLGNILHIDAIASPTLGAYRWFYLGPIGFQPSEFLKLALLIYIASFIGRRYKEGNLNDMQESILPILIAVGISLGIVVVIQKDLGTGLSIASAIGAMLFVSGIDKKILIKIGLGFSALCLLAILLFPHRMQRITTFFTHDVFSESSATSDEDYHIKNAMIALGSGGMFGRGIGRSIQATGYLPETVNDSIFAVIGETFGFVGAVFIVVMFTGLLIRLLRISDRLPEMSMRLVVVGVFGWLFAHIIMNIFSMIGLLPLTGITLPLLSLGGTSLVFMSLALGIVFQLSRYTVHSDSQKIKEVHYANSRSRRRVGRTRDASRRSFARN